MSDRQGKSIPESVARDGESQRSEKNWLATALFFLFLAPFGAHRFYTGNVYAGIVRLTLWCAFPVLSICAVFSPAPPMPSYAPPFAYFFYSPLVSLALLCRIALFVLRVIDCILIAKGQLKDGEGKFVVNPDSHIERKKWSATTLLACVLGVFGAHRFYVGKTGSGVAWMLTFGMFGVGWLVDIVTILLGRFRDEYGNSIAIPRITCIATLDAT